MGTHWVEAFDGDRLARKRNDRGMTQTQVATALYELEVQESETKASLAQSASRIQTLTVAVSNYESGNASPRNRVLANLATILGVDVLDLLAEDVRPTLATLRARLGLTQVQVAEQMGISRPLFAHVEQGRRDLSNTEVDRLAGVLKVTPDRIREALAAGRDPSTAAPATS